MLDNPGALLSVVRVMNSTRTGSANIVLISFLTLLAILTVASLTIVLIQQRTIARLRALPERAVSAATNISQLPAGDSISGRYHWIEDGNDLGIVSLDSDHSVTSTTGAKNARFRWTLQSEGLLVTWGNPYVLFTQASAPGHFIGSVNGKRREMVKVE
jgi:hypothetical protein